MSVGSAQPGNSEVVIVSLCNDSPRTIYAFIAFRNPDAGGQLYLSGWHSIPGKKCYENGYAQQGDFYVYAESSELNIEWSGNDAFFCTAARGTARAYNNGESCILGERLVGFRRLRISPPTGLPPSKWSEPMLWF